MSEPFFVCLLVCLFVFAFVRAHKKCEIQCKHGGTDEHNVIKCDYIFYVRDSPQIGRCLLA